MKYRKGLRTAFEMIDKIYFKARKTEDPVERERLLSTAKLMLDELKG